MAILKLLWAGLIAALLAAVAFVSGCSYDTAAGASWDLKINSPNFGTLNSNVKLTPGVLPVPAGSTLNAAPGNAAALPAGQ